VNVRPPALPLFKRLAPGIALAVVVIAFFVFDLDRFLSFDALREHREALLDWVALQPVLAPLAYMGVYAVVVAFSLPGGAVMTISGGFLFGAVSGGLYAVIGATIGATLLFLIAKTSIGDYLLEKAGPGLKKIQSGFAENALSYLFIIRLIPIFPFFLVNLAPAFAGIPLRVYFIATFFGIMPGTLVYALVGAGLGSVFDSGEAFTLGSVMTPEIIGALTGLAVLALLPVAYKKLKARSHNGAPL